MAHTDQMIGLRAPQLASKPEDWINTDGKALQLDAGVMYFVDFWDYTCINCIRTFPYIKEWYDRYKNWGFQVIGIHSPEFDFAKSRANVEEAVQRFGIKYPVVLDNDYVNWHNFANRYWPRHYLVDVDRKIVYDHIGEGGYGETEAAIQRLIRRHHPEAVLPEVMGPVKSEDMPGAVCYPVTPETYAGYRRGILGNSEGYHLNTPFTYTDPGKHEDGAIYLRGTWKATDEALIHARETQTPEDYLLLPYHALEVNVVVKPEHGAEALDVFVMQDGTPLSKEDAGEDVLFAEDGETYIHVNQPRMFRIIKNKQFGSHKLKLSSKSDAFGIYVFTFGSCIEQQ